MEGDKIERTEEIKENQGSKAVWWPAAVIIDCCNLSILLQFV